MVEFDVGHTTTYVEVLQAGGGWMRLLKLSDRDDEECGLNLLRRGVLVQPGFFYDLPGDHLVISLLTPTEDFVGGLDIIREI